MEERAPAALCGRLFPAGNRGHTRCFGKCGEKEDAAGQSGVPASKPERIPAAIHRHTKQPCLLMFAVMKAGGFPHIGQHDFLSMLCTRRGKSIQKESHFLHFSSVYIVERTKRAAVLERSGMERKIEEIIDTYGDLLYRTGMMMLGEPQDVQDILQEVMLTYMRKAPSPYPCQLSIKL